MGIAVASGNKSLFQKFESELSNPVALVLKAKEGMSITLFNTLAAFTGLSKTQLASFIHADPKTLRNYKTRKQKLGRVESEQLLQILNLYKKGTEVFDSVKTFNQWLKEPAFGLGNSTPLELMYTPGGISLIMEELLRIEFGALA